MRAVFGILAGVMSILRALASLRSDADEDPDAVEYYESTAGAR